MRLDFEEQVDRIYGANPSSISSYQRNKHEITFTSYSPHSVKREVVFEQQIKNQVDLDILALLGHRLSDHVYWFDIVLILQDSCYSLQTTLNAHTQYYHTIFSYLDFKKNPNEWHTGQENMFPDLFLLDALQTAIRRYLEKHPAFRLYFATGMLSSHSQ